MKDIQICEEEIKLSIVIDDMIIENHKESIKTLLELELARSQDTKLACKKSITFLCTDNQYGKKTAIKSKLPFIITLNIMKDNKICTVCVY